MKRTSLLIVALTAGASALPAQSVPLPVPSAASGEYSPKYDLPIGRQIVVVYIGQTGCGASRDPELKKAVRRMKPMVARQADSLKRPLSLSGVALDWAVDSGVAYLHGLGAWNEIAVGNNWGNVAAVGYIWRGADALPAIPQVLIYERVVTQTKHGISFGPEHRISQYVSADEIIRWVHDGAPLLKPHVAQPLKRLPAS